jgi:hypothetical protein
MFKKLIAFVIIISTILSLAGMTYAAAGKTNVFTLVESKNGEKVMDPQFPVSGLAEEGTKMTLTHYWYKVGQDESIVKKKTSKNGNESGEWVLVNDSDEWTIGASGIFSKELELKKGQNKIVLTGKDKAGNKETETIMVELTDKSGLDDYMNNLFMKDIDINQK